MASMDLTDLQTVKDYLGIKLDGDDNFIKTLITAKSTEIETRTSRSFKQQTYTETYDGAGEGWGLGHLMLAQSPIASITSLTVDGTAIPARPSPTGTGYTFDTDEVIHLDGYTFTRGEQNVTVVYIAGYSAAPPDLALACAYLVAAELQKRKRVGVANENIQGQSRTFETDEPKWVTRIIESYSTRQS